MILKDLTNWPYFYFIEIVIDLTIILPIDKIILIKKKVIISFFGLFL